MLYKVKYLNKNASCQLSDYQKVSRIINSFFNSFIIFINFFHKYINMQNKNLVKINNSVWQLVIYQLGFFNKLSINWSYLKILDINIINKRF
jgi:hypothetical protein